MNTKAPPRTIRQPSLADALIPLVTLAVLIGGSIALFGLAALSGPIQTALVVCAMVAALIALKNGHSWEAVQASGQRAMSSVTSAVFILLSSGAILYETSNIIHGGETNYIRATVSLYVSLYNIFVSLLSILGFASRD